MKCNYQRTNLSNYSLSEFQTGFKILKIQGMRPENDFIHVFSYSWNLENCFMWLYIVDLEEASSLQLFARVPEISVLLNQ